MADFRRNERRPSLGRRRHQIGRRRWAPPAGRRGRQLEAGVRSRLADLRDGDIAHMPARRVVGARSA